MGTKNAPSKFDCWDRALTDEPRFALLARDPDFAALLIAWTTLRMQRIARGDRGPADIPMVMEALTIAERGRDWRADNKGIWHVQHNTRPLSEPPQSRGKLCKRPK